MFVIIRKVTWLICYSKRARISRTGASKNCIELMRNKSISGLKFSRISLSQKQTQSSMEEMLRFFPPVVLKECHFLKRGRHLGGSCKLVTNNHEDLALSNLKQDK